MLLPSLLRTTLLPTTDERGQDVIEYVLITALVAFVIIIILDQFTPGIGSWLQELFRPGGAGDAL
jgi:Flp pilus assembly pilin Flp